MSARDQIQLFLEMCLTVIAVIIFIKVFMVGDRVLIAASLLKGMSPIIILIGVAYMKLRYSQYDQKRYKIETGASDEEYVLYLNYYHKIASDLVLFSVPILILSIALFSNAELDKEDIIQAATAFVLVYYWQGMLFKRRER